MPKPAKSPAIRARLKALRGAMKQHRIGAYLVTKHMDLFYLTGFTGEDSAGLFTPTRVHLLSDGRFEEAIRQECPWVTTTLRKGTLNQEIAKVCKALKLRSIAVQPDRVTLADVDEIGALNKTLKLRKAPDLTGQMRRLKDEVELRAMRKAIRVAEDAFVATVASIRTGQTELEMAARIEFEMKQRGASGPSFPTICAEGANAALPHAHAGRRRVREGSAILFDWGARVGMYCSDLTRMVFIGRVRARLAHIYNIVLEAQQRSIRACVVGARMCDVDQVARSHIDACGFGEQFNHSLGHGLGLDVHEPPMVSWRSREAMAAGMLVTVEPGIYVPRVGGVRIEDDVLVTEGRPRVLSRLPRTLDAAMVR